MHLQQPVAAARPDGGVQVIVIGIIVVVLIGFVLYMLYEAFNG